MKLCIEDHKYVSKALDYHSSSAAKVGAQVQALQMALGVEPVKRQLNEGTPLDLEALQKDILRKGGIIDVDKFYVKGEQRPAPQVEGEPGVQGVGGGDVSNTAPAALQAILSQR